MKKQFTIFSLLVLITLPTLLPFFNSKFFYTQDYIFIARLQQMSTALNQGQFPVRWAPDLRYGEPLFNYYAPLPYYVGAVLRLFGFNFIWVAKILFILSTFLSACAMYLFAKELFGKEESALFSSFMYTWSPYRAVDMYVRGSLSETWAFIFFPLIFYASLRLAKNFNFTNIIFLSLSVAGLLLTHNVSTLMFLPFLLLWWVYLIFRENNVRVLLRLLPGTLLGFGLAAFYLLPAFLESNFIQTKYLTVGYFNFRAHFVAAGQFFSTFWGYGSSVWGPEDGLSFQIGIVNIAVVLLSGFFVFLNRQNKKLLLLYLFLLFTLGASIFLQHNKSAFIWETFKEMAFIQFPWRFLEIAIFVIPVMGGLLALYLKGVMKVTFAVLILLTLFINLNYFRPKQYADDSFFDKFLNVNSLRKGVDLTKDYLPIWVETTDKERFELPRTKEGDIVVSNFNKRNKLDFSISTSTDSTVEVPLTYFPGWQVKANGEILVQEPPGEEGLISFRLPKGQYFIDITLENTAIRTAGNIISVVSLLAVLLLFGIKKKYEKA